MIPSITRELQLAAGNVMHHRLVIIQWLYCGDRDGGEYLAERLAQEKVATESLYYFPCRTKQHFESQIRNVIDSTTLEDVPLLHLLTHGGATGLAGCDPMAPRCDGRVTWIELDQLLCALAAKAGFRNLVVLAGCSTQAIRTYWGNRSPAGTDRMLVAHHDDIVYEDTSIQAMALFYKSIFSDKLDPLEAECRANLFAASQDQEGMLTVDLLDV